MLLAIDVGNTHTVLGLFARDEVVDHWRIATDARRTADELAILVRGLIGQYSTPAPPAQTATTSGAFPPATAPPATAPGVPHRGAPGAPKGVVGGIAICSTVPSVLHELREMVRRYYGGVPTVLVEPGVRTGVPVLIDNPKEAGADRIINALAAAHLFGGPCIVVDFGTATTFDAVSTRGEYLGGAIAPGIEISVEALGARGAQLRRVELTRPRSVIGKNTVEALQSGILYGFAGQVDGVVERMARELADDPDDVTVVATGGLAPLVLEEARTIDVHEPWLTLTGLRLVYERNTAHMPS